MITVPKEISKEIQLLIDAIGVSEKAVYVPCKLSFGSPQNECFPLVDKKVEYEGGQRILGWQIWEGQLLVEAEFHAIWKSMSGELIDITPKSKPFDEILFLPSKKAKYEGK